MIEHLTSLAIDNLIFISVLTNKLPAEKRHNARRIGIGAGSIVVNITTA